MLKNLVSALVVALVLCGTLVWAGEAKTNKNRQIQWEMQRPVSTDADWTERYFISLPHQYVCAVLIKSNGSVLLSAQDYDWNNMEVVHVALIDAEGVLVDEDIRFVSKDARPRRQGNGLYLPPQTSEGGYQVFAAKCSPHAGKLPEKIRKKFHGRFGVK